MGAADLRQRIAPLGQSLVAFIRQPSATHFEQLLEFLGFDIRLSGLEFEGTKIF
jgi:hypothetical protein